MRIEAIGKKLRLRRFDSTSNRILDGWRSHGPALPGADFLRAEKDVDHYAKNEHRGFVGLRKLGRSKF